MEAEKRLVLKNASLLTLAAGIPEVVPAGAVVVKGKRIVSVGPSTGTTGYADAEVVDLKGFTLMPGLIDCHVHLTMDPDPDPLEKMKESPAMAVLRGFRNARRTLEAGFTTVRDMGARDFIDIDLRQAIEEGVVEGPRMLVSGKAIVMTGGHGYFFGREADGADDARRAAREQLKAGADLLKLMATGGVMTPGVEPGSPQLTFEELEAAIEEAHKAGRKTATHAQGTQGIKNALLAGIDSIEHGIFLDDETINIMKERGVYFIPTRSAVEMIVKHGTAAGIPEYAVRKAEQSRDAHLDSIKAAHEAGVKIVCGTDAGTPFNEHGANAMEAAFLVEAGLSIEEVLAGSTIDAAGCLGLQDDIGSIEPGKFADFVAIEGNPLDDINLLRTGVRMVFKEGKLVHQAE